MEHDEIDYERNGTTGSPLKDISVRLSRIEGILNKGAPVLSVEDAVSAFRGHIGKIHRCPENFDYLLEVFGSSLRGRNIATLCPAEVEGFIHRIWGGRKDSTIAKRVDQLSAFFNFCIRILKRSGSHGFINPCNLIEKTTRGTRVVTEDRLGFIDVGRMRDLLGTFADSGQWPLFAILATAGIRVGELLKLRPMDVDGRVLTLMYPKSGKEREYAVVLEIVALKRTCPPKTVPLVIRMGL